MRKPAALRAHLVGAIPALQRDADRLLLFVDAGSVSGTFVPGGSFRYAYTLNVIATDMSGDPDRLMFHLMEWVRAEQPDLMSNPSRREEVRFEVDVLANDKYDLSIKLPVSEVVIVSIDPDGQTAFGNPLEPEPAAEWLAVSG